MLADKIQTFSLMVVFEFLDQKLEFALTVLLYKHYRLVFRYFYNFYVFAILWIPNNFQNITNEFDFNEHLFTINELCFQ